ncbi:MAG: precorrin-6y C5,15-methyltransferase (decarboxylating) subunit CbiE [Lachnospiraceae bacterium]|nr:precorrin-6y C5,15-methyltransferase (decarboxylating) subunit CbiE [Lachnospiraceae bacterium]
MRHITVIGVGMGNVRTLTLEALFRLGQADVIFGGTRLIDNYRKYREELKSQLGIYMEDWKESQELIPEYRVRYLKEMLPEKDGEVVILASGDTGFYSLTRNLLAQLKEEVEVLPGISVLSYFSAKTGLSWDDAYIVNRHSVKESVLPAVLKNKKVFLLTVRDAGKICRELTDAGYGNCEVYIGTDLSYDTEQIICKKANEVAEDFTCTSLSVMMIVRCVQVNKAWFGIPDEEFIRGRAPMTKSEVRAVVLSKLRIAKEDIVYDIGAGTGSVTVEMAMQASKGHVYAIEVEEENAKELIPANLKRFGIENVTTVCGMAPEVLEQKKLEKPDKAFIGGTKGNLRRTLNWLFAKNAQIRIVATAVTIETIAELAAYAKEQELQMDICQLNVAKGEKAGASHLMRGANPVYVVVLE